MKRTKHTLSNYRLQTFDMGKLVPIGLQECLPGDTFQLSTSAMIRVTPLAAPVMHPVHVRIHHFFVPHRLVWSGWEDFITGGPDGMDVSSPPRLVVPATTKGTLYDYMGIPPNASGCSIIDLPIRGINLIWNEYYRDQDLQAERGALSNDVPDIAWGKDYFTAARPWSQKGPEVSLPIGTQAPIKGFGFQAAANNSGPKTGVIESDGEIRDYTDAVGTPSSNVFIEAVTDGSRRPNIFADLSQAGAVSIIDFRRAFALQRYQEARARYGSRYTEYLRYLGVTPSDARLQRPEYLGGGSTRLNFSEVLQTAPAGAYADETPREGFGVGDLYGHGIAGFRGARVRRFIEEHGYLHSFISVRPKGIYMNGIPRHFLRSTKEDYWQKELEHIGQQEILQNEIYAEPANTVQDVFGYQDRYSEYRETPSTVAGDFRDVLDFWHLARALPDTTALNEDFVKCVPTKRVFNVQTNHTLWAMINNHVVARRMVSGSAGSKIL